ncbi:MAG: PEP-CTERM sorting domain-containing protein [Okeania sp. SIO3B3]|nr:PEP-CTERM sorting domain-containing protein [Okeania sp. SIO3B3]
MLLGFATTFVSPTPALAASTDRFADVVFVVDESGSMGGEHAWLKNAVVALEAEFNAAGIGNGADINQYGLVGFSVGKSNAQRVSHQVGNGKLGSSNDLVTALAQLSLDGNIEDGYAGMDEALSYPFRPGSSVNIVLVTDEDRDNTDASLTYSSILSNFSTQNALLNAVVNINLKDDKGTTALGFDGNKNAYLPDGNGGYVMSSAGVAVSEAGTTEKDYAKLAWTAQNGSAVGAVWDLNQLRQGGLIADSFSQAFAEVKVQEIIETPTPKPVPVLPPCQSVKCSEFANQKDAQALFNALPDDRFGLDPDRDGIACE